MKKILFILIGLLIIVIPIILLISKKKENDYSNLTIIGDSRMVGLCSYNFYKETKSTCIAEVGMGYDWFINYAINKVNSLNKEKKENILNDIGINDLYKEKTEYIAINLGVNDLYNIDNYIKKYKELKDTWDVKIILVSVNPTKYSYEHLNEEIDKFNEKLKSLDGFIYCDTASMLKKEGFLSNDGLHYEKETSKKIFEKILECME